MERDTESTNDYFNARYYASNIAARFLTPDPYNGSYDQMNPQSFNRYMYVNGNTLAFTDPSGLAGIGALTGIGGAPCVGLKVGAINPCDPFASILSIGISNGIKDLFPSITIPTGQLLGNVTPLVSFAVTFGCGFAPSSDATSSLCGQSGWTSAVFTGKNKWVGTLVNDSVAYVGLVDSLAVPSAAVAAGYSSSFTYLISCITGPGDPVCDVALALAAYTIANFIYSVFRDAFGPPEFTGSLLPRPSDLGGLGTAQMGIPNQNLSLNDIMKQ